MKNSIKTMTLAVAAAVIALSFTTIAFEKKMIKATESSVNWKAYKVTGSHEGTIDVKSGFLNFDGKKLTGGEVVVNMKSVNTTDLTGDSKASLDGHLKSDDFFSVANHETATIVFKSVKAAKNNKYAVNADLTIKGKTSPVNFDLFVGDNKATAYLNVDRTKYDIKYGSASFFDGLKDKAINDMFDLNVTLKY